MNIYEWEVQVDLTDHEYEEPVFRWFHFFRQQSFYIGLFSFFHRKRCFFIRVWIAQ